MSKAFTKEDDDGGFIPPSSALAGIPSGPFHITTTGLRIARAHSDARVGDATNHADVLPRIIDPQSATLGVTVIATSSSSKSKSNTKSNSAGTTRRYRLVSSEERALIGDGCSIEGPIGRVLLGARVGDVREVLLPRGAEELEVIALEGEPEVVIPAALPR